MANNLISENSPYLLQHANNPVNWYPWSESILQLARQEDKPIFLSVGYAACHWCHVMAHESFEDLETATLLNSFFVNIKVDREERPDLDGIYMQAVVAMTGQGGWPMSVFLTPDGVPFFGGTYFPPVRKYNLPSFSEILITIARLWKEDREQIIQSGAQIISHIQLQNQMQQPENPLTFQLVERAASALSKGYDWQNGGWGSAPKFPQPMTIEFLLRKATRGDVFARDIAVHALNSMAKGGMYDVVGGGFARYATDSAWCVPHFEKMLYDNSQLAAVYLHGWMITRDPKFRDVCERTLDFVLREMTHPEGGFYSSLDADSEGEEGKFYVWSYKEIRDLIADEDFALFASAYDLTQEGNFDGKIVLQRFQTDEQVAQKLGLSVEAVGIKINELHQFLFHKRSFRERPGTDDKVLTAWNGLMLAAFAEAGRYFQRRDYLVAAQRNAKFLLTQMMVNGRLQRSWRSGKAQHTAYLEDYAALVIGLLALYQSDGNPNWYSNALSLAEQMVAHFLDSQGGFFDTRDDHEKLLFRPKDLQDNATPSGNALAACALLKLAAYEGKADFQQMVEKMLSGIQSYAVRYPTAYAQWLQAIDFYLGPVNEVVIIGEPTTPLTQEFVLEVWKEYRPRQVFALSSLPVAPGSPALLEGKPMQNGLPTGYVCQAFSCKAPTNSPETLRKQLEP